MIRTFILITLVELFGLLEKWSGIPLEEVAINVPNWLIAIMLIGIVWQDFKEIFA